MSQAKGAVEYTADEQNRIASFEAIAQALENGKARAEHAPWDSKTTPMAIGAKNVNTIYKDTQVQVFIVWLSFMGTYSWLLYALPTTPTRADTATILEMHVHPKHRKKGIGTMLIWMMCHHLHPSPMSGSDDDPPESKVKKVKVVAKTCVERAAGFYETSGFTPNKVVTASAKELELDLPCAPQHRVYGPLFEDISPRLHSLYTVSPELTIPPDTFEELVKGDWYYLDRTGYGQRWPYAYMGKAANGDIELVNHHTRQELILDPSHKGKLVPTTDPGEEPVVNTKTILDPEPANKTNSAAQLQEQQVEQQQEKIYVCDSHQILDPVIVAFGGKKQNATHICMPNNSCVNIRYKPGLLHCVFCPTNDSISEADSRAIEDRLGLHDKSDPNKKPKL